MSHETNPPRDLLETARSADGGLHDVGWYLGWNTWRDKATLVGNFTAAELRAIADHMEQNFRARDEKP